MPFGAPLLLAATVFENFISGQAEFGYGCATGCVRYCRVLPEAANQDYFIDGARH
jgi:hypothetical protein